MFGVEPRYLGYRDEDRAQPYAAFFEPATAPVPARVTEALAAGPLEPELVPRFEDLDDELSRPGYAPVETGYGRLPGSRKLWLACLTDMPGVRPEMWDWWFGWHGWESARYKLWHPSAHAITSMREDRRGPGLSDTERYVGNTSYVDEWIGASLQQLAIRFRDPADAGFSAAARAGALIYARAGSSTAPLDLGWVIHQVRATPTGSEMRSRFYLNDPGLAPVRPRTAVAGVLRGLAPIPRLPFRLSFAADLLEHCGAEMHHLARFLPSLHERFSPLSP